MSFARRPFVISSALAFVFCTWSGVAAQRNLGERWKAAALAHEPGLQDVAAAEIAEWTAPQLLDALNAVKRSAPSNDLLRRGAVLHLDIIRFYNPKATGSLQPGSVRTEPLTFLVEDGSGRGLTATSTRPHLEFARALLEDVTPAPARDPAVRLWYTATSAILAGKFDLAEAVTHLRRARELFPKDPELLIASGCLYETFAAPRTQAVVRGTVEGGGRMLAVGSERDNLRAAERMFRAALRVDRKNGEARLRLGHTLGGQGRHKEAIAELQRALKSGLDPAGLYYATMLLGREEEMLGRLDTAREHYESAARIFPKAQSPHLALTRLAVHDGDTRRAERALQPVFDLPRDESERFDPWWMYFGGQSRFADGFLKGLYDRVRAGH